MHLIHHHDIDFNCTSKSLGFEVQKQCGDVAQTELYPAMDKLLSRFDHPDLVWTIDRIEINISCGANNWKQALVQETLLQLEEFLKNAYKPEKSDKEKISVFVDDDKMTTSEYCFRLFLLFLKNGILPVNSISSKIEDIIENIAWNEILRTDLYAVLTESPAILLRFILTVPDEVKNRISEQISNKTLPIAAENQVDTKIDPVIQKGNPKVQRLLQEVFIWSEFFKYRITSDYLEKLIAELAKLFDVDSVKANLNILLKSGIFDRIGLDEKFFDEANRFLEDKNVIDKAKKTENRSEIEGNRILDSDSAQSIEEIKPELKAVFIENAGLIILHPFFESLFDNLKLCKDKKWMDAEGQHKAVLVMQYLCTGSEEFWDSDLFFNKLYCGFNPDSVINTSIALTDNDKTQCDEMLAAVIGHWKKLGNTSIEGLRETFLRRNGKVVLSDNELTLNVENSGVDILLEYLPWSIRIVKSPWLDKIINCYWEY